VNCNYCGSNIILDSFEELNDAVKQLNMNGFESFLRQKGVQYDPVSRAVTVGGTIFFIDSSGLVMGQPEALRQVVLRWIAEYTSQT
jgi:hypothetical protein